MTQISVSELKTNTGKYVTMAKDQDIFITKNGKVVAKIVTAKPDKREAFKHFMSLFPKEGLDLDPDKIRDERLKEWIEP